ncbi:hypothetical protein H2198_004354 [Neophaeococcomyces mojaviensis]|uniref:Uncharacterized protein n=1 Tax=Neophaeococcomyces mojaviensis TaxID=3383035 RepID=A0ACC3A9J5_9EURO|nr:hypothetical protein H2198_004354 [Knufia sp. JES_112]
MYGSEESRWRAVQTRDRLADSTFVYAVTTTRIFCRPICPARLARRANVKFFDTAAAALTANFRACKRCKPDHAAGPDPSKRLVDAACVQIHNAQGQLTLAELAKRIGVSSRYLHGVFSSAMGCTPAVYAAQYKRSTESEPSSISPVFAHDGGTLQMMENIVYAPDMELPDLYPDAASTDSSMMSIDFDFYCSPDSYADAERLEYDMYSPVTESCPVLP